MDENRDMIRFWAEQPDPDPVRESFSRRQALENEMDRLKKRFLPTLVGVALFLIYTIVLINGVNAWTKGKDQKIMESAVRSARATERSYIFEVANITPEKFADMEKAKESGQPKILTGDESKQAAIEALAVPISQHIAGLRMDRGVTVAGAKTYIWGVDFARLDSGKYGRTIEEVLSGTVEGYTEGHSTRPEDDNLAKELCTAYYNGELPSKWTPDLEFAEINADGSVTARNELHTGSRTKFWSLDE